LIVTNSTPLIYLAKIGKLREIIKYFGQLVIPETVYYETVRKGIELGKPEANIISKLISEGHIRIEKVEKILGEIKGLHRGEAEALSLAKAKSCELIVDDKIAYQYARILGIKVLRSIRVMLTLTKNKRLTLNDLEKNLRLLSKSGFWLTADVYARILEEAHATR
jgi:hypothetical protein